jgi:hypothetical protein
MNKRDKDVLTLVLRTIMLGIAMIVAQLPELSSSNSDFENLLDNSNETLEIWRKE